jgi:hypothetical protein
MAVRKGFAVGDFDPSFPLDDKFVMLANLLPTADYLAASGLYWHLLAAAWRDGRRATIRRIFPTAPEPLVAALRQVELLDARDMVTRRAFDHWVGSALARRAAETARKAAQRAGKSQNNSASSGTDWHQPERMSRGTPAESQQVQVQVGIDVPNGDGRTTGGGAGGGNGYDVDAWVAMSNAIDGFTGRPHSLRSPHGRLGEMALDLAAAFGLPTTLAAFQRTAAITDHPDASQIILGANRRLRPIPGSREARQSEEAERGRAQSRSAMERTRALIEEQKRYLAEAEDDPVLQAGASARYHREQRPQVHTEGSS